jgi:hypothetical protein
MDGEIVKIRRKPGISGVGWTQVCAQYKLDPSATYFAKRNPKNRKSFFIYKEKPTYPMPYFFEGHLPNFDVINLGPPREFKEFF